MPPHLPQRAAARQRDVSPLPAAGRYLSPAPAARRASHSNAPVPKISSPALANLKSASAAQQPLRSPGRAMRDPESLVAAAVRRMALDDQRAAQQDRCAGCWPVRLAPSSGISILFVCLHCSKYFTHQHLEARMTVSCLMCNRNRCTL